MGVRVRVRIRVKVRVIGLGLAARALLAFASMRSARSLSTQKRPVACSTITAPLQRHGKVCSLRKHADSP